MITKQNTVYIICPSNFATGGPEALHQLGAELLNNGINTFMLYFNFDKDKYERPIDDIYTSYNVPFVLQIENDSEKNIVIFPETFCIYLWNTKFIKAQKIVWWLSVTNFFISLNQAEEHLKMTIPKFTFKRYFKNYPIPTIKNLKKLKVMHIAHSYFSYVFLKKKELNVIGRISDYMNDAFTNETSSNDVKENMVIYNPKKNDFFLEKIIQLSSSLNWVAVENLSPTQVSSLMAKAKVYIDFGYHIGKERMPREACLKDCCLIIGKDGSAKFKEDMPILDEFHFEKSEKYIPQIVVQIYNCIKNYDTEILKFKDYKNIIIKEKEIFKSAANKTFLQKN